MKRFVSILIIILTTMTMVLPAYGKEPLFSPEEQAYIDEGKIIKAASIEGVAPYNYTSSTGEIKGIAISVLDEIAQVSGLKFECILYDNSEEVIASDADIHPSSSKTYLLPGYVLSKSYMKSETVLFYNSEFDPTNLKGKRFAAIRGGILPNGIKEEDVVYFKNREDTFAGVDKGMADYGYGNAYSLAFYSLQNNYKNLTTIPQGQERRDYAIAVKESDEVLLSIINKSLASIDENRMQTLILEISSQVERKISFSMIMDEYGHMIIFLVFIILASLLWSIWFFVKANRRLKNDIKTIRAQEEEIRNLSYCDPLTQVYNRAFYDKEINRIKNSGRLPYSIIMGDVNGLKFTNDIFGHKAGDALLKRVADTLKKSCRGSDSVIRYGGDEFVILLPDTSHEEAQMVVNRIKERCVDRCNNLIPSSISIGFSTKDETKLDKSIFQEAENMMYQDKLKGSGEIKNEILEYLEDLLYERNIKTEGHGDRLVETTKILGQALNLSEKDMEELELLARFYDIGKVIDVKTDQEATSHVETGYRIAISSEVLRDVAEPILSHHERWDGKGKPRGLRGKEIPIEARILSVAEAYGEIRELEKSEIIKHLEGMKGKQLDPNLVDLLISLI